MAFALQLRAGGRARQKAGFRLRPPLVAWAQPSRPPHPRQKLWAASVSLSPISCSASIPPPSIQQTDPQASSEMEDRHALFQRRLRKEERGGWSPATGCSKRSPEATALRARPWGRRAGPAPGKRRVSGGSQARGRGEAAVKQSFGAGGCEAAGSGGVGGPTPV